VSPESTQTLQNAFDAEFPMHAPGTERGARSVLEHVQRWRAAWAAMDGAKPPEKTEDAVQAATQLIRSIFQAATHDAAVDVVLAFQNARQQVDQAELAQWRMLSDPAALHVHLLRGIPARLSRDHLLHLLGSEDPVFAQKGQGDSAHQEAMGALQAQLDEADRRAGAAERECEGYRAECTRLHAVRDAMKRQWGVGANVSFDAVWLEALALKQASPGSPRSPACEDTPDGQLG
jgi:hypothetical protein